MDVSAAVKVSVAVCGVIAFISNIVAFFVSATSMSYGAGIVEQTKSTAVRFSHMATLVNNVTFAEGRLTKLIEQLSDLENEKLILNKMIDELDRPLQQSCPKSTTLVGHECFSFHTIARTWSDAQVYCESKGGSLPEFDFPELDFLDITRKIPGLADKIVDDKRNSVPFWLGAKDELVEGTWVWESGKLLTLDDPRWGEDQPNNHGDGQHCLIIDYDKHLGYKNITAGLEDNPCLLTFNILCEYPVYLSL